MTVEGEDRVRVCGLDVVELDRMVAGGGEVSLVGRDAKAVDLGVWVWDSPGAYTGESFPESGVLCQYALLPMGDETYANLIVWS